MSRTRILCLGDLHLGLPPSRLPPEAYRATTGRGVSTAAVWLRAVETAVDEGAALVLLSGDVVDRANRYFEAFGPLEEGLDRLDEAGIPACAVAGNHDAEVLDRLHRVVGRGRLHLLGTGGRWERYTLEDASGRPLVHVDGWSFPGRDVVDDPTASHDLDRPADGAPVLGLLHGELDRPGSTNAPLSRAGLARTPVDSWLLGHLHKPGPVDLGGGRWALYPGSPQPLDPTESGVHGAWWVEVEDGALGTPRQEPLATVRYERLEIDLTGTETVEDVRGEITGQVRDAVDALELAGDPEWLILQGELTGRTGAHGELKSLARKVRGPEGEESLDLETLSGRARLVELLVRTRPPLDLEERAEADDPPGLLAGLILSLEPGASEPEEAAQLTMAPGASVPPELMRAARRREREAAGHGAFAALGRSEDGRGEEGEDPEAAEERTRRRLARVAASLLDALLETKETRRGEEGADGP